MGGMAHPNGFGRSALLGLLLAVFMLISGLMEDTVFETFPGTSTMLWMACCLVSVIPAEVLFPERNE
jgi:hypothetical protein